MVRVIGGDARAVIAVRAASGFPGVVIAVKATSDFSMYRGRIFVGLLSPATESKKLRVSQQITAEEYAGTENNNPVTQTNKKHSQKFRYAP